MRTLLVLTALALATAGCGLFSTNPAEPPIAGPGGVPPNFTSPESTLATFARAIHDRSITNYGQALADTLLESNPSSPLPSEFHAVYDPADIIEWQNAGHPNYIVDWRRNDELTLFPQFIANFPDAFYDTYFTVDEDRGGIINLGGPSQKQIWNLHYRVWAGATPVAAGTAGITFERVGLAGDYKMTYWEDHRDTTNVRTWGKHRLEGR
jgi:hypothetical protein